MITHTTKFFLFFAGACCVSSTAMSGYCVNTTSVPKISSRTVNSTSKNGMLMKSRRLLTGQATSLGHSATEVVVLTRQATSFPLVVRLTVHLKQKE